jgi:hypothetical protein
MVAKVRSFKNFGRIKNKLKVRGRQEVKQTLKPGYWNQGPATPGFLIKFILIP